MIRRPQQRTRKQRNVPLPFSPTIPILAPGKYARLIFFSICHHHMIPAADHPMVNSDNTFGQHRSKFNHPLATKLRRIYSIHTCLPLSSVLDTARIWYTYSRRFVSTVAAAALGGLELLLGVPFPLLRPFFLPPFLLLARFFAFRPIVGTDRALCTRCAHCVLRAANEPSLIRTIPPLHRKAVPLRTMPLCQWADPAPVQLQP